MRSLDAALGLAVAALFAAAPAGAQASRDTLADAVVSALEDNPSLLAEIATRRTADEALKQARSAQLPSLGLRGSYGAQEQELGRTFTFGGLTFPQDGATQRATLGLEARQTLYAGGALGAQERQARAGVTQAEAALHAFEQKLILDVVTAYVDVRRAESEVDIREQNVDALRQQVQAATDRFDVGEVTRTDVEQAKARAAGSEGDLAAARARLASSRANYQQIVGRAPVQLAEPPPPPQTPGAVDTAIAAAMLENPELEAARAAEKGAEEAIGVAKGQLRPRVGLVGNAGVIETYQDRTFRDTNVGLSAELSIPIYQGGLLASKTRQARLKADRARYERMSTERTVTAQASTAWNNLIAAREAITAARSRVAAAEVALEGAEQELAVGTRITLDVLDQERELLDARLFLIDAERSAYIAAHQLLAVVGRLRVEAIGR